MGSHHRIFILFDEVETGWASIAEYYCTYAKVVAQLLAVTVALWQLYVSLDMANIVGFGNPILTCVIIHRRFQGSISRKISRRSKNFLKCIIHHIGLNTKRNFWTDALTNFHTFHQKICNDRCLVAKCRSTQDSSLFHLSNIIMITTFSIFWMPLHIVLYYIEPRSLLIVIEIYSLSIIIEIQEM